MRLISRTSNDELLVPQIPLHLFRVKHQFYLHYNGRTSTKGYDSTIENPYRDRENTLDNVDAATKTKLGPASGRTLKSSDDKLKGNPANGGKSQLMCKPTKPSTAGVWLRGFL